MKNIFYKTIALCSIFLLINCQADNKEFGAITPPSNLNITAEIVGQSTTDPNGDGSGKVNFTAKADNAISYKFDFGDGINKNVPSGIIQYGYTKNGVYTYTVTVTASGKAGVAITKTMQVTVKSTYTDALAVQHLTGGTSKRWYWSASEPGHLGVGQNDNNDTKNYYANYYQASPWEKATSADSSCLYNNVLTFSTDGTQLFFNLDNGGDTFFNSSYQSVAGGTAGYDHCYSYNAGGTKIVSLSPSTSFVAANASHATETTGTVMNFSDNGFMGYYIGQSSYEILSITDNRMVVRAVQGNNPALAWYHIFTTIAPVQDPIADYTNLVWSDEFNTDGAPDPTKWSYDLGNGGWGNGEAEFYTNNPSNIIVQNGSLKITAKAQSQGGSNYTSARIKTYNNYEFTYGKVEVRAKLPSGGGTWPAIWMLGHNYSTWPACGEMDLMEEVGNTPNKVFASLHYPGHSGGNSVTNSTTVANSQSDFNIYKILWTPNSIRFYVNNVLYHSFPNSSSIPFNSNCFLILNVAMGGNFGGAIDPAFTQSTMEVDYVRVYQ